MTINLFRRFYTFGLLTVFWTPLQAVTVTPVARLTVLGGQYFTNATHSSGANLDGALVPVITFTPTLYLIPMYLAAYRETQSVYNFLGQNTLIRRQLDQTLVLRSSWEFANGWRLKPRLGYQKEWTQQSTSDTLWNGIFRYDKKWMGSSVEKVLANGSIELGYEYSPVRYPNYQSLLADPRLTRTGVTKDAGVHVLDFNSHQMSVLATHEAADHFWKTDSAFTWIRESFVDQKIILSGANNTQDFSGTRRDDILTLGLQQTVHPSRSCTFGFGETVQYYLSNQNAFDPSQRFSDPFTSHYYDYVDIQLTPSVTYSFRQGRHDLTLSGTAGYRRYSHRRVEDGLGNDQNRLIYSTDRGGALTFRTIIWKGLRLVLTSSVLTYASNTRYEANYPYNYTVWNYLGGFSWEY